MFRLAGFRRLIIAAFVSGIGDALIPIAFAIESHRMEPSGWGLTIVLLSLWTGRFLGIFVVHRSGPTANPIRVMIASDVVRLMAQAGLLIWLLLRAGQGDSVAVSIAAFAGSSAIYGIATAFFGPARFAAIPKIVPLADHGQANAWLSMFGDFFAITGPLVGSVIVLWFGFHAVLLMDALSFLIGIFLLARIKITHTEVSRDAMATEKNEHPDTGQPADAVSLPPWVNTGLFTWLFVALTIGLMGIAGPTLVMDRNSVSIWAATATCMAIGSLVGSTSSLFGVVKAVPWKYLQCLCCLGLAVQLLCFLFITTPFMVWAAGFVGAALVTVSAVRWDTIGQSIGSNAQVHAFAVRDQTVHTIGIPAGMLVFGVSGALDVRTAVVTSVAIVIAVIGVFTLWLKTKPTEQI